MIVLDNLKSAQAMVDKENALLEQRAHVLAETLGTYGFEGELTLTLAVNVSGGQDSALGRTLKITFSRR